MGEATGHHRAEGVGEQIQAEHRSIRDLAREVGDSSDPRELIARLRHLRSALVTHFVSEEAPDGLYEMIRSTAPRQLSHVDQLQKEHEVLLQEIEQIDAAARACLAGPVAEVLSAGRELVRRLHKHEAAEDSLLLDTMYTDLGQGE